MATIGTPGAPLNVSVGPAAGAAPTQELTSFSKWQLRMNLLGGDKLTFDALGRAPEVAQIDELATDVWLRGPIRQRFRIIAVDQQWGADGDDTVTVTAVDYKRLMDSRLVQPGAGSNGGIDFIGVDQGDIVWGLVDHAQSPLGGALGITKGATTTGVIRDRRYQPGDNIGDRLGELQAVIDGPWWGIDADLVLTAHDIDTFPTIPQPIVLGVNARSLQRRSVASQFANAVVGVGNQDHTTPVFSTAANIGTDPRGRWEKQRAWTTVEQQSTLDENTAGALAEANNPLATWNVVIEATRWQADTLLLPGHFAVVARPADVAAVIGAPAERVLCQCGEAGIDYTADGELTATLAMIETNLPLP